MPSLFLNPAYECLSTEEKVLWHRMQANRNGHAVWRQWQHVEDSMIERGASPKRAAMVANAVVRDHPAKSRAKGRRS